MLLSRSLKPSYLNSISELGVTLVSDWSALDGLHRAGRVDDHIDCAAVRTERHAAGVVVDAARKSADEI